MNNFLIIIPCYILKQSDIKYLNYCLKSIEGQEYPKNLIKISIIDDNSIIPIKVNTNLNYRLIRNEKRMYPAYNRYNQYKLCPDNDIIIFLDGDDWFIDTKCLKIIDNIYSNNDIKWSLSNHKTFKNGKLNFLPVNVKVPKEIDKPYICHLRCGYGYVWNKMDINWIKMDGNFIRWMSDWNEILYALNNYGQPFKINTSLIVYNLESNKTKNENNNYKNMINFFKSKLL